MSLEFGNNCISITYFILQYTVNNTPSKGIIKQLQFTNSVKTSILIGSEWFDLETISLDYDINNNILHIKTNSLTTEFIINISYSMIKDINSFCDYKIKMINENKEIEGTGNISAYYDTYLLLRYIGLDKKEYEYKFIKIINKNGIVIKIYINKKCFVLHPRKFKMEQNNYII